MAITSPNYPLGGSQFQEIWLFWLFFQPMPKSWDINPLRPGFHQLAKTEIHQDGWFNTGWPHCLGKCGRNSAETTFRGGARTWRGLPKIYGCHVLPKGQTGGSSSANIGLALWNSSGVPNGSPGTTTPDSNGTMCCVNKPMDSSFGMSGCWNTWSHLV